MALQESRRFHSFFLLAPEAGIPGATLSYNNRKPANIHVYEEKDIDTIGFWRAIMRNEINVNDGESVESSVPRISEGSAAAAGPCHASKCPAQHDCLGRSVAGTESILKHCFNGQGHKSLSIV